MKLSAALLVLLSLLGCARTSDSPTTTTASAAPVGAGPRITFPNGHVVAVEIAADDETRAQGLMYRDQVRPGTGMLFLFPKDDIYSFWMKNTITSLDIIWMTPDGLVVDIKSDVPPCQADPCPSYAPSGTARYVLEVGAGVAKQQTLVPGSRVRIEGIERYAAR